MDEAVLQRKLRRFIKRNNLRYVVFQSLRGLSSSAKMWTYDYDVKAVTADGGWTNEKTMYKHYTTVHDEERRINSTQVFQQKFYDNKGAEPQPQTPNSGNIDPVALANAIQLLQNPAMLAAMQLLSGQQPNQLQSCGTVAETA